VAVGVALVGYYLLTKRRGPTVVNYKTYTDEKYSFKFDYPENWDFGTRGAVNTSMASYFTAYANENITECVVYVYDRNVYENFFENRFAISLDNIAGLISRLENFNNENFVLIGKPTEIVINHYHGVRYSFITSKLAPFAVRCQAEQIANDNYFYDFETVVPDENYSTYEPILEHVIDSFTLLD